MITMVAIFVKFCYNLSICKQGKKMSSSNVCANIYTACAECMQMCILRINKNLLNTTCCITHISSTASFKIYFNILHLDINPFYLSIYLSIYLEVYAQCMQPIYMASVHNVLCQVFYSSAHKLLYDNCAAARPAYIDIN